VAGLVLLVVVAVGAVAQWHAPDSGTSTSAPEPSPSVDDAGMSIGHGFIPNEPTTDPDGQPTGSGRPTGVDPASGTDPAPGADAAGVTSPSGDATGTTSVVDAATGLPVDGARASGPWWRRALPIAGDLIPIGGEVRGERAEVGGDRPPRGRG
jgi:hypothetical protein